MSEHPPAYCPDRAISQRDLEEMRKQSALRALYTLRARAQELWLVLQTQEDSIQWREHSARLVEAVSTLTSIAVADLTGDSLASVYRQFDGKGAKS